MTPYQIVLYHHSIVITPLQSGQLLAVPAGPALALTITDGVIYSFNRYYHRWELESFF